MSEDGKNAKRPKRTYRACLPCRSRKLKCSFGDPNAPWSGPCERCLREQRDCVKSAPTKVRPPVPRRSESSSAATPYATGRPGSSSGKRREGKRRRSNSHSGDDGRYSSEYESEGEDTLIKTSLHHPSDALKLLASASSLQYKLGPRVNKNVNTGGPSNNASVWSQWQPIENGILSIQEARSLCSFFELEMAPLYPLLHPYVFEPSYLPSLVRSESLLLGTIIVIAARYSRVLPEGRGAAIHTQLAQWVRLGLLSVLDGDPSVRNVSSVEALLLLSEWPIVSMPGARERTEGSEQSRLLQPSMRYDSYSWANIGLAVRLAQELGIHEVVKLKREEKTPWLHSRTLKTWVYCYNADRHIAVRLGRNAVFQEQMTSRWWETISRFVTEREDDVHASDAFMLGAIAQLMGTIQDHLYPNKEITRSLLRTGAWESFVRSLRLEIRYSKRVAQDKLTNGSLQAALLRIELDYVVLYAYSLALRALQSKLKRRRLANDIHYASPSLLNMVEGPWIMEALSAARSMIEITLTMFEEKGKLRHCPSRIFQYILFATTFLYKALATGMVEHGEQSITGLLERVVKALGEAAIDEEHFLHGFAELLGRIQKHWRSRGAAAAAANERQLFASLQPKGKESDQPDMSFAVPSHLPQPQLTPAQIQEQLQHIHQQQQAGLDNSQASNGASSRPMDTFAFSDLSLFTAAPNPLVTLDPKDDAGALSWDFNPLFQMPAADLEQDVLFQNLWSADGLYATLLGDTLALPDGMEA